MNIFIIGVIVGALLACLGLIIWLANDTPQIDPTDEVERN